VPPGEGLLGRLFRELALFGGTAFALVFVSCGFVGLAFLGLLRHPERWLKLLGGAGFFGLCAAVGVWMGLERRALLLRRPSPFAGLWPRWARRGVVLATREGLAQLGRHGATVYPWETIATVSLGEVSGNAALFVRLLHDAVPLRAPAPERPLFSPERWARSEAFGRRVQRTLTDFDLAILGVLTEEGPGALLRQIESALTDEAARAALPAVAEALASRQGGRAS
jgi:hypothetical protein